MNIDWEELSIRVGSIMLGVMVSIGVLWLMINLMPPIKIVIVN